MKTEKNILKIGGREFNIILTLSVIEDLQNKFEDLNTVLEKMNDFGTMTKELTEIATVFINDYVECYNEDNADKQEKVTSQWVSRRIALNDNQTDEGKILASELALCIMKAFQLSMPEAEDADPNSQTTE